MNQRLIVCRTLLNDPYTATRSNLCLYELSTTRYTKTEEDVTY